MRRLGEGSSDVATAKVAVCYSMLAALSIALSLALREGVPWEHPSPWLRLGAPVRHLASGALGAAFGAMLVVLTRAMVARFAFARRLHVELRPVAVAMSQGQILLLAGLSSLGEELLFRGLLAPTLGLLPQALLFGLAHQIRGPSRWVWVAWASAVGLGLGLVFAATGSLVGPLVCHAVVNAVNLSFLRDHDPDRPGPSEAG